MNSKQMKETIIRILSDYNGQAVSGYLIYKMLKVKGIQTWPNHVYTALVEMERKDGLLQSKWVGGKGLKGTHRKHLYSLSELGREEYNKLVKNSLGILMNCFLNDNLSFEDLSYHAELVRETFGLQSGWSSDSSFKLVIASPNYHPLICFPKFYYALSEAYPNSSIYVVRKQWENESRPIEGRRNLTFLDGARDEIPLKNGFADYVLLQGFPRSSSVEATMCECMRVAKERTGCLLVEIPSILTSERRAQYITTFPEYVLRLFYELCSEDRDDVQLGKVMELLSSNFRSVKSMEVRGKVIFYAFKKESQAHR